MTVYAIEQFFWLDILESQPCIWATPCNIRLLLKKHGRSRLLHFACFPSYSLASLPILKYPKRLICWYCNVPLKIPTRCVTSSSLRILEDESGMLYQQNSYTKQLQDSCPLCFQTDIVGLTVTQPVSQSEKFLWICIYSFYQICFLRDNTSPHHEEKPVLYATRPYKNWG